MKIPRGKYIAKTLIRTSMKPSISSCAKRAADGLIAVILAACLIIRDRIICRRKIESTRVTQTATHALTVCDHRDADVSPSWLHHGGLVARRRRFLPLPRGHQLVTLEDAAKYIQKLPAAEQQIAEWQAAVDALLLVVELDGPTMMARIGVMRALTSSECSIQLVNATRQWFII